MCATSAATATVSAMAKVNVSVSVSVQVSGSVTASGGLDSDTFESVPGDSDLLAPLSDEMEERVKAL